MSDHSVDASGGSGAIPFQSPADEAGAGERGGTANTTSHGLPPEGVPPAEAERLDIVEADEANSIARLVGASFPSAISNAPRSREVAPDRPQTVGSASALLWPSAAGEPENEEAGSEICDPIIGSRVRAATAGPEGNGSPAAPVAPLGNPGQRQRREPEGRQYAILVRVSGQDRAAIRARAEAAGVSPPRLLVELATLGPAGATERNAVRTVLVDARRQIAGVANNVNQIARWANARQQLPPGLVAAMAAVERMELKVDDLLAAVEPWKGQPQ